MNIRFNSGTPEDIVHKISNKLSKRRLGQLVTFELQNEKLVVTIKKIGTSHLSFLNMKPNTGVHWRLQEEKIAFSHRMFKVEVLNKITTIIEQVGGSIEI